MLYLNSVSASEITSCKTFYVLSSVLKTSPPSGQSIEFFQRVMDKVGPFGVQDFANSSLFAHGVRPKFAFRGLGSVFVIRPDNLSLNRDQLSIKSRQLHARLNAIKDVSVTRDELTLLRYFISQLEFAAADHNFNISSREALKWIDQYKQFRNEGHQKSHWAHQALAGLQSLKFLLRVELPKTKNLYFDDTGTLHQAGTMTVFYNSEFRPEQAPSLVYRLKYYGKWYRPDGPIKKIWEPLLKFNQKSVAFLSVSDERMSGEELVFQIRQIYSDVVSEFQN